MDEKFYTDLLSIQDKVDIVDIFRRSDAVVPIIEEATKIGAKAVWMQEGIINEEVAEKAKAVGPLVVMDKCMLKEHMKIRHILPQ
jgi:predicted CoA-binding protein